MKNCKPYVEQKFFRICLDRSSCKLEGTERGREHSNISSKKSPKKLMRGCVTYDEREKGNRTICCNCFCCEIEPIKQAWMYVPR